LTFKGGITALLAGNALLVKTTSSCPAFGELIEKLVRQAGFDGGEYQCIHASYDMLDKILAHKSVAGVSFTGSTAAGSKISAKAGQYLKKSVMELGGNDPFVVLKDADL
jgi:succinate-semialdehyde dehydrogenase/glutarate-semialdehyde dehydrogenase